MFAFDDISSPDQLYFVWLAAFGSALVLALIGLMCLACRGGRVSRGSWAVWSLASFFPLAVCLSDAARRLGGALSGPLALVAEAALLAAVAVACCLIARGRAPRPSGSTSAAAGCRLSWSLLVGNAVAAAWAAMCFYDAVTPQAFSLAGLPAAAKWVRVADARGLT